MSEKHFDLSKLRIKRDSVDVPNGDKIPRKGRFSLLLYISAGLFIIIAVIFTVKNISTKDEVVEITTAILISPAQANAILTASGYVVAQRQASIASKATGRLVYLGCYG